MSQKGDGHTWSCSDVRFVAKLPVSIAAGRSRDHGPYETRPTRRGVQDVTASPARRVLQHVRCDLA